MTDSEVVTVTPACFVAASQVALADAVHLDFFVGHRMSLRLEKKNKSTIIEF